MVDRCNVRVAGQRLRGIGHTKIIFTHNHVKAWAWHETKITSLLLLHHL